MIKHFMEQGSPEWHAIRRGKVTGTSLISVIGQKSQPMKLMDEIIAEDVSGMSDDEDGYVSDDMQRGIDLEPVARDAYADLVGFEVEQVGFLQSERWPNLGVSPDGLIADYGALSCKCPKTKTHVRYIREGVLPKEYLPEILCLFLVHDKLFWVDFISYDPRFSVKPEFIVRVNRTDVTKELEEAAGKVDKFFADLEGTRTKIIFGTSVVVARREEALNTTIVE